MVYSIAQISDIHIGSTNVGSGDRFSLAIDEINAMTAQPDLVLLTGDLTESGLPNEWAELQERLTALEAPWQAINGNHDEAIVELAGHRSMTAGPLHLVLLDTSDGTFADEDAAWLENELAEHADEPTVIAMHHPPFETGIWWMDCVGLKGADRCEEVVRRHPQVIKILSGHVHRVIQTNWGSCALWVCPSTSVTVAGDIDPAHVPAETAEPPSFSLHVYTGSGIVSHVVPVGPTAVRAPIDSPEFMGWLRSVQKERSSIFG